MSNQTTVVYLITITTPRHNCDSSSFIMAITVYSNQARAGTVDTDRLITYQSANRSTEVESCIDIVIAVKGLYIEESSDMSSKRDSRFDKFMAHLSLGNSDDKVPLTGLARCQGSLERLEAMVEKAKAEGLTGLNTWVSVVDLSVVDPTGPVLRESVDVFLRRYTRLVKLMDQVKSMIDRLGGQCQMLSHRFGLFKIELTADEALSSYDGFNPEQSDSDGLPLAAYQPGWVCGFRLPKKPVI